MKAGERDWGGSPRTFPSTGLGGQVQESDLRSCNFAEGIESAEILQAMSSSEGDAFELTVSCQGG